MLKNKVLHIISAALLSTALQAPLALSAPEDNSPSITQNETRISINSASADAIAQHLIGIGPAKANAIVAWRTKNGRFSSVEQLLDIKGIGTATLSKNKSRITL